MTSHLDTHHSARWGQLSDVDAYIAAQEKYRAGKRHTYFRMSERLIAWLGIPSKYDSTLAAPKIDPVERNEVKTSLLRLIRSMAPEPSFISEESSVLLGLCRQGWKDCLESTSGAHVLALAVLRYITYHTPDFPLDKATAPTVCKLLSTWCRPSEEWKTLPDIKVVCEHFFGEPWCHFNLPVSAADKNAYMRDSLKAVSRERPDFLPGLCGNSDAVFVSPTGDAPLLPNDIGFAV
jgi:hypothetical protein